MGTCSFDSRDSLAIGNAATPQKLELIGFSEETQLWAGETFLKIAKSLTRTNHFQPDEWLEMETRARLAIKKDKSIAWDPATSAMTLQQYLAGVIQQKLRHAAAEVADERSVWTQSRVSLDAAHGTGEEDDVSLLDLVTDGATLGANQPLVTQPRAIAVRNKIKRLRDKKEHVSLAAFRAKLRGEMFSCPPWAQFAELREPDDAENEISDAIDLRRIKGHATAVAEVGYAPDEDNEDMPKSPCPLHARSAGFGNPAAAVERLERKIDIRAVLRRLEPIERRWCLLVMNKADPVETYKDLGIDKNYYYKKFLPKLRRQLAEYK